MKILTSNVKAARNIRAICFVTVLTLPAVLPLAQTVPSDPPYSVVDRGPFYDTFQRTVSVTNETGAVSQLVQSYTLLQDGMNYWSNAWVEAHDVVDLTATGAEATHGQMTASFDNDITSDPAILDGHGPFPNAPTAAGH